MYNISPESFDVAFRTFAEVPQRELLVRPRPWPLRRDGGADEIGCANLIANFNAPAVKADFASIGIDSPADFLGYMLMDKEHVARYLARKRDSQINTDDQRLPGISDAVRIHRTHRCHRSRVDQIRRLGCGPQLRRRLYSG